MIMEKENVFAANDFSAPLYDSYEDGDRKQYRIYIPGFKESELTITFHEGVMNIKGQYDKFRPKFFNTGFWGNFYGKDFDIDIPVGPGMAFVESTLSLGILDIFFRSVDNRPQVLPINVPQPRSNIHPQLLNEDSDF